MYIDSKYLFKKGFIASRFFCKRHNQFRVLFEKEGYDGMLIVAPVMQVVPNDGLESMSVEEQVEEFSSMEILLDHNIGDFNICLNSIENHITTFRYKKQLDLFIDLTENLDDFEILNLL